MGVKWVIMTLQTTKPKDFRRIAIHLDELSPNPPEETMQEWHDLDRLLAGLWTSHSIRPRIMCCGHMMGLAQSLLPELTSKGVDFEDENRLLG